MQCAGCGHDNRAGRRFCAGCGAGLEAPCARCGFTNLPEERFCGGCGGPLDAAAPVGERRQVAILFADLAGYTRLSTQLDPEELHRLLEGFFEVVDGACTRFGATIDKHIGDNVMAIFGAPIAHGDDPARAVRASIDIHRDVAAYSTRVGRELLVHVGIGYGEVIASGSGSSHHRAYTVTGDAVNLAARLQDKAVGGETLISDAVYRAADRTVVAEAVGDVTVKGLAAPVPVWRVTGLREAPAPTRVVGRDRELTAIAEALARPGAVVVLRGEAGMGKSTIVGEVMRGSPRRVHAGQVLDFGAGRGAGAIASLTASLLDAGDDRRAALDAAVRTGRVTAAEAPHLANLLEVELPDGLVDPDADADERERRERRRRALCRLATDGAPLLVVEDVHWADAQTLALLRHLADAGATMLLTTRIDGDPLGGWRDTQLFDLEPLAAEDAARLAATQLDDAGLVARCVARAGGNPLYLEQLIAAAAGDDALPGTLQGLVLARVDRLPPRDKVALQAASIAGQRASLALIRHLSGDRTWAPAELIARRLLRLVDDDELAFHHALILDGVYSSLTHARRKELHRLAAAFHAGRDPELRAEHLERAGDPGAAAAWHEAAEAQVMRQALDRALALIGRGVGCATTAADRYALHALAGRLHLEIGDGTSAEKAWTAALPDAVDDVARCRALVGLAGSYRLTAGYAQALRVLDEAEPLAIAHGLQLEEVQIAYYRGSVAFGINQPQVCRDQHQRALELSRAIGALDWETRALSGIGDAHYVRAEFPEAHAAFEECVALCERRGQRRYALINRVMEADSGALLDRFPWAIAQLRAAADEAVALHAKRGEALAIESLAMLYLMSWRYDDTELATPRALELTRGLGMRAIEMFMLVLDAEVRMVRGDRPAALAAVARAIDLRRELGTDFLSGSIASLDLVVADTPEACLRPLETAEDHVLLAGIGSVMYRRGAIEATLRHGLFDQASRQAQLLLDGFPELPYARFVGERGLALATWGRGDRGDAVRAELARLRAWAARQEMQAPFPAEDA